MRLDIVIKYSGLVLVFNGCFMVISALVSAVYHDGALMPLMYSAIVSILFGIFPFLFVPSDLPISNKEGFFIVAGSWLLCCVTGMIPFILWGGEFSPANAWFESVSGFTTTGSSILQNIEALPMGLLFWRSATHFIGGIGIIVFMLSVLPFMGKAEMVLYRAEMSSLVQEAFHHRTRRILQILLYVYAGLTLFETIALLLCGMNLFDAVTHSFATIATGGFSPKNMSIAHYKSPLIETVVMVFMVLSGINFALLFGAIMGSMLKFLRSPIVKYYCITLALGVIFVTLNIHGADYDSWTTALRHGAFQVISLGTSTGFASADSSVWPSFSQLILIFFTLQCACAGSTSGGIKADRMLLFLKVVKKRIFLFQHPKAVAAVKIGKQNVEHDSIESAVSYITLYLAVVFLSALLLAFMGVDGLTAFSGSAAAMGNVGPGFGTVGSMANFSHIPDGSKWILTAVMLLGRLEIFGIIALFARNTWKY